MKRALSLRLTRVAFMNFIKIESKWPTQSDYGQLISLPWITSCSRSLHGNHFATNARVHIVRV